RAQGLGQARAPAGTGAGRGLPLERDELWSARRRGCDERCIGQTFCSGESQLLGRLQCRWRKAFGRFVPETAPPPAVLRLKRKWRNSKGEINRLGPDRRMTQCRTMNDSAKSHPALDAQISRR